MPSTSSSTTLQLAKKRLGNHFAKSRSYVTRTSKKAYAQKGTGQARRGNLRAPGLEGGGAAFPPHRRDYSFKLNKKTRKAALRSILSAKIKENKIFVLDGHGLAKIQTKAASSLMARLGLAKGIIVIPKKDDVIEKSFRNLEKFKAIRVEGLNAYDLLRYENVVLLKESVAMIEERLG